VHAFFASDPFDNVFQEEDTLIQAATEKKDSTVFPRQWALAKLKSDFTVLEGARELGDITNETVVENFFDVVILLLSKIPVSQLQISTKTIPSPSP